MTKLIKNKNNFMIIEERQIKFCERKDEKSRRKIKKVSCVPQKTHSQQAMTKVKYVLVPDVK
jgi:hypothetical protein